MKFQMIVNGSRDMIKSDNYNYASCLHKKYLQYDWLIGVQY